MPYFSIDSIIYSEHEGSKRHFKRIESGAKYWYIRIKHMSPFFKNTVMYANNPKNDIESVGIVLKPNLVIRLKDKIVIPTGVIT